MGGGSLPAIYLIWGQTVTEVMKIMMTSSKDPMHALLHSVTPTLQQATNNSDLLWKLLVLTGKSGSVSCGITAPFFWVLAHTRFCLYPRRVHFPTLCKLWQLYDGVNGNLLQEGLYHTHVCCTQSSSPVADHC